MDVHQGARRLGLLLLTVHLGVLLWVTVHTTPTPWVADTNLTPLASVRVELEAGTAQAYLELLRSILALAPLGVLLPLAGGRRDAPAFASFARTLLTGILIATAIEVVQTTLGLKMANVDDILLAVLGIALVHLAVVPAGRAWLRRRADASGQGVGESPERAPKSAPDRSPEKSPEIRSLRSTGSGRVRIIGGADATALPAREA
ncbi:VanZ family protein [Streptacidiphilus fuscans]|uniref:VanZ family protein n=1 Tax=Streptacidiphilus fuscans TaxID=2789292 RepID=A0A931FIS9_9ACTN|nr:VanZ family protein [Streptacidiphilus fuscans]MBF9073236.1 VanZ family protein [Streptacidiphilus fuscans]